MLVAAKAATNNLKIGGEFMARYSYRKWTKEEEEILINRHGTYSLKSTAKKLNRPLNSVQVKAYRMGLTGNKDAFDFISKSILAEELGVSSSVIDTWIISKGLKLKKRIPCNVRVIHYIDLAEFWKWAKNHKSLINWTKLEKNVLGVEPSWVDVERKKITLGERPTRIGGWTIAEENQLAELYNGGKTCKEVAEIMGRSMDSIKGKIQRMEKTRYKRVDWRMKEIKLLKDMVRKGAKDKEIAEMLDRPKNSITTKRLELQRKGEI